MDKTIRLIKAFWKESVKRLPYVIGLLVILGIVGGVQSYRKLAEGVQIARDNTATIKQQGSDIKTLTKQNKALTEQNNELAQENATHIDCVAKTFAKYTQTLRPVYFEDLNKCITSLSSLSILNKSGSSSLAVLPQSSSVSGVASQPNNNPTNNDKQQPSSPPQPAPQPSVLERIIDTPGAILKKLDL